MSNSNEVVCTICDGKGSYCHDETAMIGIDIKCKCCDGEGYTTAKQIAKYKQGR